MQVKLACPVNGKFAEISRTGLAQAAPLPELLDEDTVEARIPSAATFAIWSY